MKFTKSDPGFTSTDYGRYRSFTQTDFRRTCAYCFRHEDDAGGENHYEQDHFEPKSRPAVDPANYWNLYWSCRGCNGKSCKGEVWPSPREASDGYVFCDPCKCNLYSRDYKQDKSGLLVALTPAGEFTIQHLRLNKRPYLVEWRRTARELRGRYVHELGRLRRLLVRLDELPVGSLSGDELELRNQVSRLVEKYEAIAYAKVFAVIPSALMPQIPQKILALAQALN